MPPVYLTGGAGTQFDVPSDFLKKSKIKDILAVIPCWYNLFEALKEL
jgi:hypothetical protein